MRAVLVLSAVVCTVCFVACGGQPGEAPTASIPVKKTWTREEFKKLVVGKKPDEVIAAVGKPDETREIPDRDALWVFYARTIDPITGKTDKAAVVRLTDNVVIEVSF